MPIRSLRALFMAVLASCGGTGAAPLPPGERPLFEYGRSGLAAHIKFLSHDRLEGRGTGTAGHARAARYVAEQLAARGVQPAGDGGTFIQQVPLRGMTLDAAGSSLEIRAGTRRRTLVAGEEVLLPPGPARPKSPSKARWCTSPMASPFRSRTTTTWPALI